MLLHRRGAGHRLLLLHHLLLFLHRLNLGLLQKRLELRKECADHDCFPSTSRAAFVRSPRRLKSPRTSPSLRLRVSDSLPTSV